MKTLLPVLLTCSACVGWSKTDTLAELAFTGEVAVDTAQSITIGVKCQEENPIVGQCGQRLAFYMPATAIVHGVVSALLPPGHWRRNWQVFTLGVEASSVMANEVGGWGIGGKGKL